MISPKDTIYIDIDDEITGIINKMQDSNGKVVALVLPKRASVLQSIVNMRLLKRAADEAKKNVVLITSEAGLLPLAGAAGMHVAKTLSSPPSVPSAPASDDREETVDEDSTDDRDVEITAATAGAIAVGALAGLPPKDEVETLELDDDEVPAVAATTGSESKGLKPLKVKQDSKLKVPNFDRFRMLLAAGGLLLTLVIIGFVFANRVLPKAVITISTDATNVNASVNLTLSTVATKLDDTTNTVPSKLVQSPKTYTQQAAATGQKNMGDRATITVSVTNCGPTATVYSGTGFSSGGLTFISQKPDVSVPSSNFTFDGKCKNDIPMSVSVIAQNGGTAYNLSSGSFAIAGNKYLSGQATAIVSKGTDNLVTTISQVDIDGAAAKIVTDDATVKKDLSTQLTQAGYFPITATFNTGTPVITTSANVGDTAASVTVTKVVTYIMFGAKQSDLNTLIDNNVKTQIDASKQSVSDQGLNAANFTVQSTTDTTAAVTMQTTAVVGPQLDAATITKQVAGKKTGDVKSMLKNNPGVTGVDIKLSPFWVTSVPKNASKITVNIAKPTKVTNSNNATTP